MGYLNITDFEREDLEYLFEYLETDKNEKIMTSDDHISVLLEECIEGLNIRPNKIYIDCTFGAGGHTRRILQEQPDIKIVAIDRDPYTEKYADELKGEFGNRFMFWNGKFSDLDLALSENSIDKVDGILMDLGFSSMQIDTPRRGFSFQHDGPLDMRMEDSGFNAEDFINEATEEEIAGIIFKYGDERKSRRIASAICNERQSNRIERTSQLANIVSRAAGKYNDTIHPATRTFQAIRMHVNNEVNEIKIGLDKALRALNIDGRLCVITFHSGEDILVKDFYREKSGAKETFSRYVPMPDVTEEKLQELKIINKKPIISNEVELKSNPRSRSAKLRVAEKINEIKS